MKYILSILLLVIFSFSINSVYAQTPGATFPPNWFCVGNNPQPPCATIEPTKGATAAPSQPVSTQPSQTQPSGTQNNPSQSPSPSTSPCSTSNQSVTEKSKGATTVMKKHSAGKNGFIKQFFQFFLQIFQLLFQQLGNQQPGSGGGIVTPEPTAGVSTTPSGAVSPTTAVSQTPSGSPCPSTNPSQSPSGAVSPTSAVSQSPSTSPSTSPSNGPTAGPSSAVSPTSAVSQSPSVAPTGEQPTATPAPGSSNLPAWLQQLLQLIVQLLQLIAQHLGINPCNGTSCPTPSGTPVPTSSPSNGPTTEPSGAPTATPSNGPSSTPSGSPSQTPSNGPSSTPTGAPTPTIFNAPTATPTPTPTTGVSPSQGVSVSPGTTVTPTPVQTGLLMSNVSAAVNKNTKLCLDDKGNGTADNNPAITWACNSSDKAQIWAQYSDNTIRINGKCLDVNKNSTANNAAVNIFKCNGGKNQQWKLTSITSGAAKGGTELLGVQSNKCLDIKQALTANGTPLEIFTCNGGNNQAWHSVTGTITPPVVGGGTVKNKGLLQSDLTNGSNHLCLDAKGAGTTNGTIAQTYLCNSKDKAQQWTQYSDNTIRFGTTNQCLEVIAQKTTNNSLVDIFTCNGGKNQQWIPVVMNGRAVLEDAQNTKMCLDIKGSSTKSPGPQMEIFTCNGGNNQGWTWTAGSSTGSGGGGTGGGGATQTNSGLIQSGMTAATLCLDSKGASAANGTVVQTFKCNSADKAQQWKGYSDGTIKFTSPNGTKATACLDVAGKGTANNTKVDLSACNGQTNQIWTMTNGGLVSKQTGKCLDVSQSSKASPGPQLEIFTCNGGNNQKWSWK
ncbi:MAG TPA: ricin-type beta-trefoil lectin domain protein [Candidatus Saccharimonadales bacterium]|nr:ricin-type beta-trefoil lectin domain protein [Candidatus Saccharimonadales bacterium]